MSLPPSSRLPSACRLKLGRDFTRLKTHGRRLVCGCLILNWLQSETPPPGRLGVVTSRKVGQAVARNRARRLLREAWRRHQHEIVPPQDMVVVARPSIFGKRFAEVEVDFLTALRRARLLAPHEPRPTPDHA